MVAHVVGEDRDQLLGCGALAKRIAQAHGGDLTLVSTPGKGSRFSLRLPVYSGSAAPEAQS